MKKGHRGCADFHKSDCPLLGGEFFRFVLAFVAHEFWCPLCLFVLAHHFLAIPPTPERISSKVMRVDIRQGCGAD